MENNSDNSTSSNFSDQSKEDQSDLPDEFTNLIQVNRSPSKFVNAIHFATQKFMLSKYWVIFLSLAIIINLILIICAEYCSSLHNQFFSQGFFSFFIPCFSFSYQCFNLVSCLQSTNKQSIIALDVIVNLFLLFEISIKWFNQSSAFWKKLSNIFDVIVFVLCIITMFLFHLKQTALEETEEISAIVIRIMRDCSQVLRILILIKNHKRTLQNSSSLIKLQTNKLDQYESLSESQNKLLSEFEEIQFIGFDLDNTLINYHIGELCVLVFNSIMRYIVKQQDYNNSLLALSYDPKIILKGSVIDREKGNILKIDSKKQIVQAHHGTQSENLDLSIYDINELFRYEGNTSDRWWSIYSYFELSMASVYLNLVDQIDKNVIPKFPYIKIKELIFNSLLFNFLTFENGFYYREIEKNPSKYIKRSKKTQKLLLQLKKEKKIVFFITNSNVEYGKFVLKYALGENFSELFNFQVYHASKPRFFCERSPFRTTENTKKPLLKIELSGEYVGGNHGDLMKQFLDYSKKFQVSSKVAYFGDHLISDIKESKKFAFWKTILIIEEMNNDKSKEKWGSCFGTKEEGSTFMTKLINSYSDYVVINLDEFYDDYTSKKLKDNNIKKLSKN